MPQAPFKTQPMPWDLAYKPTPFNPQPQLQGQAPPAPPLNQEPVIRDPQPDLSGWGQYSEDQFNQSPGLRALRGLGQADFSMPSVPDIPFASKDLQPPTQVPRPPVQNAGGINGPGKVTNPSGDIELPAEPDPFPDNPNSMVSLSESPYRQPIKSIQSSEQGLSSLKGLRGAYQPSFDSSQGDTNSQLYQLQKARQGELEERGANAHGFGGTQPGEVDRIKALLGPLNQDIQENPITTGIEEAETSRKAEQAAIGHGFKGGGVYQSGPNELSSVEPTLSPSQQEAQFGQAAEMAKINSPVEQQKVQSQGLKDVEGIRQKGALDVQKNFTDLQRQLAGNSNGQVSSVSKSGISFRPNPSINPLLNELTQARGQMERAKQGQDFSSLGYTTGQKLPEELMFEQALANVVSQTPGGADLKASVEQILQDPTIKDLPIEQIFAKLDQAEIEADMQDGTHQGPLDDDTKNIISNLIYSMRGR